MSNKRLNRAVIISVAFLGVLLICWRMEQISPGFLKYVLGVIGVAIAIYLGLKIIHFFTAKKCPRCGRPLQDLGYSIVFAGASNPDGTRDFPPIAIRYWCCPRCEDVCYHEFDYPVANSRTDANIINTYYMTKAHYRKLAYGQELPPEVSFTNAAVIQEEDYQKLRAKLATEARRHNERLGFLERT